MGAVNSSEAGCVRCIGGLYTFVAEYDNMTRADIQQLTDLLTENETAVLQYCQAQAEANSTGTGLINRLLNSLLYVREIVRDGLSAFTASPYHLPTEAELKSLLLVVGRLINYLDIYFPDSPEWDWEKDEEEWLSGAGQLEPAPATPTPEPQPSPSVRATAKDDTPMNDVIANVDAVRLGSFFNAKFKGTGNNYNYFEDMIKDIQAIKITKELAMIAVMIYDCRQYFIQRPSTFAAWLRDFFDIIGRDCPKDTRKNKYKPNDTIRRMFRYLE